MFLLLFPLVFLSNHKTFQIILSILVVFAVISSLKRTGVIVLCVYAVYFVLMMLKRNKWKVKNVILMSIIFILLMLLFVYTDIFQNTYDEYFYRFEESDGGSLNGRVDIWRNGLETWKNDGLIRMLFGGKSYVYTIKGEVLSFHNDYLETLCNFGIIGAIFLVAFIVNMFQIRSLILAQHRKNILRAWDLSIINIITLGIVSHVIYYPQLMFLQMLVMGYCHGTIKRSIQE
jgi:O-antigen ligase